jgi:hypothetical protein
LGGSGPIPIKLTSLIPAIDFDSFSFAGNIMPWSPLGPRAPSQPGADAAPASPAQAPPPTADEEADGTTDPATAPSAASPGPAAARATPSSLGQRASQIARQEVGVTEQPRGSNRGPRVDVYQGGGKGQFWCCHFVSWCVEQAGQSPFGHIASVASLRMWAREHRAYVPAGSAEPLPGDIFTMARTDRAGTAVGGHTGFVINYDAVAKRMKTVEGNVSDRVAERMRSVAEVDGYVRI